MISLQTNFIALQIWEQSTIGVLKKCVLQICSKYTGKHPCRSVTSVTLQTNFIEITLLHGCSPVNLLDNCKNAVLTNTCGELLLQIFIQHACHIFHYKLVSNLGCFLIHSYSDLPHVNGIFCNVLLDSLFARWYLKTASCYVAFSFEKNFYNKSLFFFWYLTHRSLESPPENVLRIFLYFVPRAI